MEVSKRHVRLPSCLLLRLTLGLLQACLELPLLRVGLGLHGLLEVPATYQGIDTVKNRGRTLYRALAGAGF